MPNGKLIRNLMLSLSLLIAGAAAADVPATHGMLIFGRGKIYLSHLPMFHNPHHYQAIVEAELTPDASRVFHEDQIKHPEQTVYTLVPEEFVLPDMMTSPKPFTAAIFRGHFERPGRKLIVEETRVNITSVIHFRTLVAQAPKPPAAGYLLFGTPQEAYLAHFITGRPNFDQILSVTVSDPPLMTELAQKGVVSMRFPATPDATPLAKGFAAQGLEVTRSLYTEFGDLSH